jgi:alanine dehydrogenase
MVIGVPKEVKDHETRVGLVPNAVLALREAGHSVLVEIIIEKPCGVWSGADLVVIFRPGLILFTYLHLVPPPELTDRLVKYGVNGVAYETIVETDGSLPLLTPPGVALANVAILGGGVVGTNDRLNRLRELDDIFNGFMVTLASNVYTISDPLRLADLVIGDVLVPGMSAPKLVRRDMISMMKPGSVVVDVAIGQGGCFETSRPHTDPIYFVENVLHYCVSNMPAAVPHTSAFALTNATSPYLLELANKGLERACSGHPAVAESQNRPWKELTTVAESR